MALILDAANPDGLKFVIAGDAGNVGPKFWLEFLAQAFLPLFRAEGHMDAQARIGVRRGPSLRDLIFGLCLPSAEALG